MKSRKTQQSKRAGFTLIEMLVVLAILVLLMSMVGPRILGSRNKARSHLQQAVALAPSYPDNQLCWLEALWEWGDRGKVQASLKQTEAVLQKARETLAGDAWSASWQEWEVRWAALKNRARVNLPDARRTPRP